MTYQDIQTKLELTGLPVVQNFWEIGQVPALPYIVYTFPNNSDFNADNTNYIEIVGMEVELYTDTKDIQTEKAVEAVVRAEFGPYDKSSSWISSEHMQQTIYSMEVIINNVE